MYDSVRRLVAGGAHLEVNLSVNFRSVPPLIDGFNDCFARILGTSRDGRPFDPDSGRVYQQRLDSGGEGAGEPAVWILPFEFSDREAPNVGEYRRLEGRVLARYLRRLVESSGVEIVDPLDGRPWRIRYGDVAILAVSTWGLSLLFPWLDAEGVPSLGALIGNPQCSTSPPGTKEMSMALAFDIAKPGNRLIYLRDGRQGPKVVPLSEELRVWQV